MHEIKSALILEPPYLLSMFIISKIITQNFPVLNLTSLI